MDIVPRRSNSIERNSKSKSQWLSRPINSTHTRDDGKSSAVILQWSMGSCRSLIPLSLARVVHLISIYTFSRGADDRKKLVYFKASWSGRIRTLLPWPDCVVTLKTTDFLSSSGAQGRLTVVQFEHQTADGYGMWLTGVSSMPLTKREREREEKASSEKRSSIISHLQKFLPFIDRTSILSISHSHLNHQQSPRLLFLSLPHSILAVIYSTNKTVGRGQGTAQTLNEKDYNNNNKRNVNVYVQRYVCMRVCVCAR